MQTNTLVSVGSAAFILLSVSLTGINGYPSRVVSQIVTGISFLGAGVIIKDSMSVSALNTAATIWCSAAVGSLCGVGLDTQACNVSAFIMMAPLLLRPLGLQLSRLPFVKSATAQTEYLFTIKCKEKVENHIRVLLMQYLNNDDKLLLRSLSSSDNGDPTNAIITAKIKSASPQDNLMEKIASHFHTCFKI